VSAPVENPPPLVVIIEAGVHTRLTVSCAKMPDEPSRGRLSVTFITETYNGLTVCTVWA